MSEANTWATEKGFSERLACMCHLALGMQVVQGEEQMPQPSLEKRLYKAPAGISTKQIFQTFPHRLLDKTLMVASRPVKLEYVKHGWGMAVAKV